MIDAQSSDDLSIALTEYRQEKDFRSSLLQFSFDINQMISTFLAMQQCAPSPSNTGYTAYIESCLIHIRNLTEVITNAPSFRKITIRDFIPGERSLDVKQALDFSTVRDSIDHFNSLDMGLERLIIPHQLTRFFARQW